MELTLKQQQGLKEIIEGYKNKEPYICISGYAGSGKTTLVSHAIAALDLDPERDVAYVAYTGKAAKVLSSKGNPNATTIHKLIYKTKRTSSGGYIFTLVPHLDKNYKVLVVDEVSMVPQKMWEELLSFKKFVIACGDPGQLPPINKNDANTVLEHPHVFLDEIMRQAQESEIIQISMNIRDGKTLTPYRGNEVHIIERKDMVEGMYSWADQILVGTNETRITVNKQVRRLNGIYTDEPVIGDKIISLHNQWNYLSDDEMPLTNGTIGTVTGFSKKTLYLPPHIKTRTIDILSTDFLEDGSEFIDIPIDYSNLTTGQMSLSPKEEYQLSRSTRYEGPMPMPFSYAYAITYWKAQGSEWDKVLILEESFPYDKETHIKAMYTAITRASKKCVLVLK